MASATDLVSTEYDHQETGFFVGGGDGFFSIYGSTDKGKSHTTETNVGSGLSAGGNVSVQATKDVLLQGSTVAANGDVSLDAGGNVVVTTAHTQDSGSSYSKSSGIGIGFSASESGLSVRAGYQQTDDTKNSRTDTAKGSALSAGGDLTVTAGKDVTLVGANATAGGTATLAGKNVTLTSDVNTATLSEFHQDLFAGITLSANQSLTAAGRSIVTIPDQIGGAKGGVGPTAITSVAAGLQAIDAVTGALSNPVSVSATVGVSESSSRSASTDRTIVATSITAGNVVLSADDTLALKGAQVAGLDTTTLAAKTIVLTAASATSASSGSTDGFGASVGVSTATGGYTASLNASQGRSNSSATELLATHVSGGTQLNLISSGDTTLAGAAITGGTVKATIGGDLTIQTLANTGSASNSSIGIDLGVTKANGSLSGVGGINIGTGSASTNWIAELSGITGGDVKVDVTGHTQLNGGIIDGDLTTGTLGYKNLTGSQTSEQIAVGASNTVQTGFSNSVLQGGYSSTDKQQQALATVTGNVAITDKGAQTQDLSGLNTDASKALTVTKNDRTKFNFYVSSNSIEEIANQFAGIRKGLEDLPDTLGDLPGKIQDLYVRTVNTLDPPSHDELVKSLTDSGVPSKDAETAARLIDQGGDVAAILRATQVPGAIAQLDLSNYIAGLPSGMSDRDRTDALIAYARTAGVIQDAAQTDAVTSTDPATLQIPEVVVYGASCDATCQKAKDLAGVVKSAFDTVNRWQQQYPWATYALNATIAASLMVTLGAVRGAVNFGLNFAAGMGIAEMAKIAVIEGAPLLQEAIPGLTDQEAAALVSVPVLIAAIAGGLTLSKAINTLSTTLAAYGTSLFRTAAQTTEELAALPAGFSELKSAGAAANATGNLPAGFRRVVNNATGDIEVLGPGGVIYPTEEAAGAAAAAQKVADLPVDSFKRFTNPATKETGIAGPGGIIFKTEEQAQRAYELGWDPDKAKFIPTEMLTALKLEEELGTKLTRVPDRSGGDWVDSTGKIYDALGPVPKKYFNLASFTNSISGHLNKSSMTSVIDFTGMEAADIEYVKSYINNLPANQK
jgi:hypothetical protein